MKNQAVQQRILQPVPALLQSQSTEAIATRNHLNLPLQANWQRMLGDLVECKHLQTIVGNPLAKLHSRTDLQRLETPNNSVWLLGENTLIGGLTDYWSIANIQRSDLNKQFETLDVNDHLGGNLLRFRLNEDSRWSDFPALLVHQWAQRGKPMGVPSDQHLMHELHSLNDFAHAWSNLHLPHIWYGHQSKIKGLSVDPCLMAPFLQTITDQMCPLRIAVGNRGAMQFQDGTFFDYRQNGGKLKLRSSNAEFHLYLNDIHNAHVFMPNLQVDDIQIRLYDENYYGICTFALFPKASHSDRELWSVMTSALIN